MSDLTEFHLNTSPSVAYFECIEIKHSLWPAPLRYVTNCAYGLNVKHEDGVNAYYAFMPLKISKGATSDNLDQKLSITTGDLGQVVPRLLKMIRDADSDENPQVIYRSYMSTNLNKPLEVINGLESEQSSRDHQGVTFEAVAQRLNSTGTGRENSIEMFPSNKGFY